MPKRMKWYASRDASGYAVLWVGTKPPIVSGDIYDGDDSANAEPIDFHEEMDEAIVDAIFNQLWPASIKPGECWEIAPPKRAIKKRRIKSDPPS